MLDTRITYEDLKSWIRGKECMQVILRQEIIC
jgi:hypothetical protein